MQVNVKGHDVQVPDRIKELATQKIEKIQRFFDRIISLEVTFSEEHNPRISDNRHAVDVTLTTKDHVVRAHASGPDQVTAMDRVVDKLQGQVKRLKAKMSQRPPKGGERRGGSNGSALVASEPGGNPSITRVTRFAVKPMTPEEAVLQMESLGQDFHLFIHAASEEAAVVYRRLDGTYGMIQPE